MDECKRELGLVVNNYVKARSRVLLDPVQADKAMMELLRNCGRLAAQGKSFEETIRTIANE